MLSRLAADHVEGFTDLEQALRRCGNFTFDITPVDYGMAILNGIHAVLRPDQVTSESAVAAQGV